MFLTVISDGTEHHIETEGGLLPGILREGRIPFSFPCAGAGLCGRCKALISEDGEVYREKLLCRTYATEGMIVRLIEQPPVPEKKEIPRDPEEERIHRLAAAGIAGVAVDLGTTNIKLALVNKKGEIIAGMGIPNPQRAYGADVMSRIMAASSGEDTASAMRDITRDAIRGGMGQLFSVTGLNFDKDEMMVVFAGNTAMTAILLGDNVLPLTAAPFTGMDLSLRSFEFAGAQAAAMAGLGAFVGGDISAGMYALDMLDGEEEGLFLLLDLGTNGEMVISDGNSFISCAAAAGPAFERSVGLCGSELILAIARLMEHGLLDENGVFTRDSYREKGFPVGQIIPGNGAVLSQDDVNAFILAKSAIRTGMDILMERWKKEHGGSCELTRLYVAGAFGTALDLDAAIKTGLLPSGYEDICSFEGNTSLRGAVSYLLSKNGLYKSNIILDEPDLAGRGICLNLAELPDFNDRYVAGMKLG